MFALAAFVPAASRLDGQAVPKRDDDHRAVLEIGAVGQRSVGVSSTGIGGTVAVEFTPIENWLEVETGITAIRNEVSMDFLLKKPWRLSAKSEFMAGIGPELSRPWSGGTSLATEIVADWMFWPKKNVGWYLEPSYSVTAWSGGERNLGVAVGLLVGFP
jgi:hypothetical protein